MQTCVYIYIYTRLSMFNPTIHFSSWWTTIEYWLPVMIHSSSFALATFCHALKPLMCHQVLLNKLSRVTQQLNTLRSIWDGQRPAFTEKEEPRSDWFSLPGCNLVGRSTNLQVGFPEGQKYGLYFALSRFGQLIGFLFIIYLYFIKVWIRKDYNWLTLLHPLDSKSSALWPTFFGVDRVGP